MALSKKTLGDFVRYRMRGGTDIGALGYEPYQIYSWESAAIDRLVERDLKLDQYVESELTNAQRAIAHLYLKPFVDVAMVNGVADLTTLAETSNFILESLPLYGSVNHADVSEPFVWVATESDLRRPKTSVWGFYTLRGTYLLTKNPVDGALDTLQGTISGFMAQTPAIASVPRRRQEKLINIMLELFVESNSLASIEKEAEK